MTNTMDDTNLSEILGKILEGIKDLKDEPDANETEEQRHARYVASIYDAARCRTLTFTQDKKDLRPECTFCPQKSSEDMFVSKKKKIKRPKKIPICGACKQLAFAMHVCVNYTAYERHEKTMECVKFVRNKVGLK